MFQQLKQSCSQLQTEHSELQQQLNTLKTQLAEKSQIISKIQSIINIVDLESTEIQALSNTMSKTIFDIKLTLQQNGDPTELLALLEATSLDLQQEVMQCIIASKKQVRRPQNRTNNKSARNCKENDSNTLNLRKRNITTTYKKIEETESIRSNSQQQSDDDNNDDDDECYVDKPQKKETPKRKKVKKSADQEMNDKANNLINEMFNF